MCRVLNTAAPVSGPLVKPQAFPNRCNAGRFVAQRFEKPADSGVVGRRTDHCRNNIVGLQRRRQVGIDFLFRRNCVFEQLLQKIVIEVGERLQHFLTGKGLAFRHV